MEPNNLDKDFREKLNQRKIEPSEKAWDRLDAMLSVAEEKKTKKDRKWLYIAASIVGFLLLGTFFFNSKKDLQTAPKNAVVVEENTGKDSRSEPTLNAVNPVETEVAVSEQTATDHPEKEEKSHHPKLNKSIKNEKTQIAESSVIIKNNLEKQSIKVKTSVAENPKKETAEQLLQSAEKTVVAENLVKPATKAKVKINANDLLNQVDGELELSFREKVITSVNKNYQTVKVAIANRNQQE